MSALDNWLVDGEEITLHSGHTITCRGLKAAIRAEISAKIREITTCNHLWLSEDDDGYQSCAYCDARKTA